MIKWRLLAQGCKNHFFFWKEHPILLLAISFLLGSSRYLYSTNYLLLLSWVIYLGLLRKTALLRGSAFLLFGWLYAFGLYSGAPRLEKPETIEGIFSFSSLEMHQTPFQKGFIYKGSLSFPKKIPCSFYIAKDPRPLANQDYWVKGELSERSPFHYTFKLHEWKELQRGSWSLAEKRYQAKKAFRDFLKTHTSEKTASLLGALATADVEERLLRFEFNRVGLQHILAISGFHFALLLFFLRGFLQIFFPEKMTLFLLLLLLTSYFLFIGASPAVLRSFCSAAIYLIGKLLNRRSSGLNILGTAMLIELLFDPLLSGHIGFQLSFISTAGLLFFFSPIDRFLQRYLLKRDMKILSEMSFLSVSAYTVSTLLRKSFAVALAVNITLLPLLLHHFHKFPLLGLIYNLFFPVAISLSLFLLLLSLPVYLLFAPLGKLLLFITDFWTKELLHLVTYPPLILDISFFCTWISSEMCSLYLLALLLFAIHKKSNYNN